MTDYLALLQRKSLLLDILDEELRLADENRERENDAAIKIQRLFRGAVCRDRITKKHYAGNEIQRVFRGHMGRKKARGEANKKKNTRQLYYLHFLCIQLQRCFRGYYSRKYKHDQARRKLYCRMIEQKGQEILDEMAEYARIQAEREAEEARLKREELFKTYAQSLHHLTSTAHVRGVYNPRLDCYNMPTMNHLPVEEHIRGVVKDLLRTRGITKRGLVADINGTMKIPLKGLKYRLSLQASAPYDAIQKEKAREKLLHNILTREKGSFVAGGKTKLLDKSLAPLSTGEIFMDQWANPMLVKGVPTSQKQLLESARTQKALFALPVTKPFVSSVGGNRSSTLANNIFDVIAEAEETGGAAQRHLGTGTSRFGLPASADARSGAELPPDSTIPAPPQRTSSTLRSTQTRVRTFVLGDRSKPPTSQFRSTSGKGRELSVLEESSQDTSLHSSLQGYSSSEEEDDDAFSPQVISVN